MLKKSNTKYKKMAKVSKGNTPVNVWCTFFFIYCLCALFLECLELCESTSSLSTTLEAIFLHGLKDSFLWQTLNIIAGDVERRPDRSQLLVTHNGVYAQGGYRAGIID